MPAPWPAFAGLSAHFRGVFDPVWCAGPVVEASVTDLRVEAAEPAAPATDTAPPGDGGRAAVAVWARRVRAPALLAGGGVAALWPWLTGSAAELAGDPLTGVARAAGLLAGYLIAVQVASMSRIPAVQRFLGTAALSWWHRAIGTSVLFLLSVHIGFVTAGYAAGYTSLVQQTWWLLTRYEWILAAWAGALLLFAIGTASISLLRRRMRYESWYYLHLYTYLAAFLAFLHQITLGADLTGTARTAWIIGYSAAAALFGYGRLVRPLWLAARHRLRVGRIVAEGPGVTSLWLRGRRLERLGAKPGQFLRFRFLDRAGWWQAHPFSLSTAPVGDELRITVKASGDYTSHLPEVAVGTRVLVEGPFGDFTAGRRTHDQVLLIAAGIGITPVRALLEDLPPGRAVVIYRAHGHAGAVLGGELDRLAAERQATVVYLTDREDADRVLSPDGLTALVSDLALRDVFLCGPPGLVARVRRVLRQLSVPRHHIHTDPFQL
jgi:predicted ferric reductase